MFCGTWWAFGKALANQRGNGKTWLCLSSLFKVLLTTGKLFFTAGGFPRRMNTAFFSASSSQLNFAGKPLSRMRRICSMSTSEIKPCTAMMGCSVIPKQNPNCSVLRKPLVAKPYASLSSFGPPTHNMEFSVQRNLPSTTLGHYKSWRPSSGVTSTKQTKRPSRLPKRSRQTTHFLT